MPNIGVKFPFIFTDESGVVTTSTTQPFYGLGILKVGAAGLWNHELNKILDRAVSAGAIAGTKTGRDFEFKFNRINSNNITYYERLIDFFVGQNDAHFCAFVIEKIRPGINPANVYNSSWEALLGYSYTALNRNIATDERAIILSDNYQKPNDATLHYEDYLVARLGSKVANVTMLESASCLQLQLVDVLLGCVMYHFKKNLLPVNNPSKLRLADRLAGYFPMCNGGLDWAWTCRTAPNYFSVWPFRPVTPV